MRKLDAERSVPGDPITLLIKEPNPGLPTAFGGTWGGEWGKQGTEGRAVTGRGRLVRAAACAGLDAEGWAARAAGAIVRFYSVAHF